MSADNKDLERNEDVRRTVMGYLAQRASVAQTPVQITQRLRLGNDFSLEEVRDACLFLLSDEMLTQETDAFGTTKYYQATAKGIRAWEESQAV